MDLFLQIIITVAIVIVVLALFVLERFLIKRREETIKKSVILLMFIGSMVVFFAGVFGIILIWNYDIIPILTKFWNDVVAFLKTSVPALIGTVIVIFVWVLILRISKITLKRIGDKPGPLQKRRKTISKVIISIINYSLAIIGIIIILAIWGVSVLPALAGLGIVGLVVGLGAQKFIQDLIAGFFIIFEHHYDVGDVIEVGGFKGTVTDIGLKTTRLRNWRGEIKLLNNGDVNTFINYSKNPSVAIVLFTIAYKEDIDKTISALNDSFPTFRSQHKETLLEDPTVSGVMNLGPNGVELRITVKTLNEQHHGVERDLRKLVKETLQAHNIEIPFTQIMVHQPKE